MDIVGRTNEVKQLNAFYQSASPRFLALYGRRRVGKTYLIWELFHAKKGALFFNVSGLRDGAMATQIANVMTRIEEVFLAGLKLQPVQKWRDVFAVLHDLITKQPKHQKIVLFFDELPWMATPRSKLLETLDYYWNQYWSHDKRIKLIICGSSASWIIRKVIKSRGGLHNRVTDKMVLKPFSLCETKAYLKHRNIDLNNQQILLLYLVTGGVPFYLEQIKKKQTAAKMIEALAFQPGAFFLTEFDHLFASLFEDSEVHNKVVRALAQHREGLAKTTLLSLVGLDGGTGLKKLDELEDAGFIMRFKPLYHKKRGTYYRLIDEYSLFYLTWIEPVKDQLHAHALDKGYWQAMQNTPAWYSWLGYAFESVCYKHLLAIRRALGLSPLDIASTWRFVPPKGSSAQGAQIDLLFDQQDGAVGICEMKYSDKPFVVNKSYAATLERKVSVFQKQTRTRKQLLLYMIAASGVARNHHAQRVLSGIVSLSDLFKPL